MSKKEDNIVGRSRRNKPGKGGKNTSKPLSKSQVKKLDRLAKNVEEEMEIIGPDKYKIGEVSSRRRQADREEGLKDLIASNEVMEEGSLDEESVDELGRAFWKTPPQ